MSAGPWDFTIEQGATFTRLIEYLDTYDCSDDNNNIPFDLTGWSARMTIRKTYQSEDPILALTMSNGLSIPTPANGIVQILIDAVTTASFDFQCAVYDLELFIPSEPSAGVNRLVQGKITLSPESTR